MKAPVTLVLGREEVLLRVGLKPPRSFKPVLTLEVEKGVLKILAVEEDRYAMSAAIADAWRNGAPGVLESVTAPGEEATWEPFWRWPSIGDPSDRIAPRSYLVLWPMRADTWNPYLLTGVIQYALASCGVRPGRMLRRVRLHLDFSAEFTDLERAELFDAVASISGSFRIYLPAALRIAPPPPSPLDRAYAWARGAHVLMFAGLLLSAAFLRTHTFALLIVGGALLGIALPLRRRLERLASQAAGQARRRSSELDKGDVTRASQRKTLPPP